MSITISQPQPYSALTLVRQGGTPNFTICATGSASKDGLTLSGVWGQIIGIGVNPPPTPPAGAKAGAVSSGNWSFKGGAASEIPYAPCATNPNTNNGAVAIWCKYSDGSYEVQSTNFAGKCSTTTSCDGASPSQQTDEVILAAGQTGDETTASS